MADLLEIRDLTVEFRTPEGVVKAVNGVSYGVSPGQIVAVVGESGSGKSVTALSVLKLIATPPGRVVRGSVTFDGQSLLDMSESDIRHIRAKRIAMIFQEPMTSLNPVLSIERQMTEGMRLHLGITQAQAREKAVELLELVGISEARRRLAQYPHHLSGGMRQRVMIAMAISCKPDLIIADEPTTALDVTIQAQILELMQDLCRRFGVALVIITHNLGVVARYADEMSVMYAGRVVENGKARDIYRDPRHPYTAGLLNSVPRLDRARGAPLDPIPGNPPDMLALPEGCAFRQRCSHASARCTKIPPLSVGENGHGVACFEAGRSLGGDA